MSELVQDEVDSKEISTNVEEKSTLLMVAKKTMNEEPEQNLPSQNEISLTDSVKQIFSGKNYSVYLTTAWIYSAFAYMGSFFNLYLRALGWDFLLIGAVFSITALVSSTTRLLGGYVGDKTDRKKLSVIAMLMMAAYHLVIGLFTDPLFIIVGLLILSSMNLAKSGSSAYIMENLPKEHSGLGLSLFTAGRALGIITLLVFGFLTPIMGFPDAFRIVFLSGGILLLLATLARQRFLSSGAPTEEREQKTGFQDFIRENRRAVKLLLASVPGLLSIAIIDSLSDAFFHFGALIYANEVLMIDISGINLMLLVTIVISVPLLLKVGRITDKRGVKRAALMIYSVMPICASLLIIAPFVPLWVPIAWYNSMEILFPGLGVVFTTTFIAIVMKYINDTIWWLVVLSLIQKNLPKHDTAKILSIFWVVVYICTSIGPVIAGAMFTFLDPIFLFLVVLVLNLSILTVIGAGKFGENQNGNQQEVIK
ncbi:MAG: MFS transporter [Candidatus Thorarchaeota archaeon]